jgi:hypothetical protein
VDLKAWSEHKQTKERKMDNRPVFFCLEGLTFRREPRGDVTITMHGMTELIKAETWQSIVSSMTGDDSALVHAVVRALHPYTNEPFGVRPVEPPVPLERTTR